MAANNLLDKAVPIYHRFVDNQVLTDDQLNEVLDHVNYQDKLTRTGLIGVGIACGLKVAASGNNITLSEGIAVSTDGDILKMDHTVFKGFQPFSDENVLYDHFRDGDKTIPLYELETDTSSSDVTPLSAFVSETGIALDRRVAILYLEHYLKDKEDCSPLDCNAQGREVVNRLRFLVTSIDHAKKIAKKDSIFSGILPDNQSDILNKIDSLLPKRVVINTASGSTYSTIKNAFAVDFTALQNRLGQLSELSIFKDLQEKSNIKIKDRLNNVSAGELTFQYVYDFYRDLAIAYNELLTQVRKNYTICCPDTGAFPKHVMLGEVSFRPIYLRHRFYASPIHDHGGTIDLLRTMFLRILKMIRQFDLQLTREVRITPSRGNHFPLGQRALPVYYNPQSTDEAEDILSVWDTENRTMPWNYAKMGYPNPNFDPLDYCLDDHDFFRIEGHIGMEITEAMKSVKQIRDRKGLAFDFVPIAVGQIADDATLDYDKYNMYFEDLQVILQAWNEEQKCIISGTTKFFTGFSIANKGMHLAYTTKTDEAPVDSMAAPHVNKPVDARFTIMAAREKAMETNYMMAKSAKAPKDNNVLINVEDDEESVGNLYKNVWKTSDGSSDIQLKARDALKDKISDWEVEYQVAIAEIPANLLGKLKATEDSKLINIEDFTEENLEKYIAALEAQCNTAKEAKKKLQNQVDKDGSALRGQSYIENYFYVLNRVIASCCLVEKVKILYQAILDRKQELLGKMVLSEYSKSHPGATHKAGVAQGGTFILLYYSTLRPKLVANERFTLAATSKDSAGNRLSTIGETEKEKDIIDRLRSIDADLRNRGELFGGVTDEKRFSNINDIIAGRASGLSAARSNLSHGVVIGDLCLPYICCTDTPATTFVFPEQEVRLFIGKEYACVPSQGAAENILMEVSPSDATVSAFVNETPLEDVIVKTDKNFFFNPNNVPEQQFGKTISFKINGQNTREQLKVLRKPAARFTVLDKIIYRNENTLAVITVRNTSDDIAGQHFNWDFGDGITKEVDGIEFQYAYQVTPGGSYTFTIELSAANESCTDKVSADVVIEVPRNETTPTNCLELTKDELNQGRIGIEEELERNRNVLKDQIVFFRETFAPLYDRILEDLERNLTGDDDTELYNLIELLQHSIAERLNVNLTTMQQRAYLHMYYENVLLYFYLQRCRETSINVRRGKEISSQWVDFTSNATDTFIEALLALVKEHRYDRSLTTLRKTLDGRLSGSLKKILDQMIELFKKAFENN